MPVCKSKNMEDKHVLYWAVHSVYLDRKICEYMKNRMCLCLHNCGCIYGCTCACGKRALPLACPKRVLSMVQIKLQRKKKDSAYFVE